MFTSNGNILPSGHMVHEMCLRLVNTPAESTGEWDIFHQPETIPGDRAFRSMATSGCDPAQIALQ